VVEQHARWIAASGAGSISLSGGERELDRAVHEVMDVMKDHGIAVTSGSAATDRDIACRRPLFVDRTAGRRDILILRTRMGRAPC
jgi:hypothetical protein